ncbi:nitrogenase component 1 [uncultured Succiniclasticum sp.]|uniref:nitrogenase component 1 n=1 Tax=uncultured Succiniclasticum sp. TaxID=1500547 RepID=UPI0025E4A69F|nr:nitrogenase component 1 [uncultured Succiniclasticum sp.]
MRDNDFKTSCHHMSTCALTGASAFFDAIPGSFMLINGPLWCYFYAMKYVEDYDASALRRFHCTQPEGNALVYGTEKDLLAGLDFVKANFTPERIFILNNCSVSLVGDDIAGIAAKAELPCPVYAADCGGIAGDFAEGYEIALLRVIAEVKKNANGKRDLADVSEANSKKAVEAKESGNLTPEAIDCKPSVNLLGLSPTYFRGEEDIKEIRRILETAGYRINAIPGGGSAWNEIMQLPKADLNLVLRDELALKAAKELQAAFGTPYLSVGMPYGIQGTLRWLDTINATLPAKNREAIRQEAETVNTRLQFRSSNMQSLWGPLWFDNILIAAPPSEAAGIAEAVRDEWADTGNLVIHFTQDTALRPQAATKICIAGKDDGAMKETFENWSGGLVMGSSLEASRLVRLKKPFVNCNIVLPAYHEIIATDSPLCGIRGAAYLFERIWNAKLSGCMDEVKSTR